MDELKELDDTMDLIRHQSKVISDLQKKVSDLQSEVQAKDYQLSEALSIAEELQKQTTDLSRLQSKNQALRQSLRECDRRMEMRLADLRKQQQLEKQHWELERRQLEVKLAGHTNRQEKHDSEMKNRTPPCDSDSEFFLWSPVHYLCNDRLGSLSVFRYYSRSE